MSAPAAATVPAIDPVDLLDDAALLKAMLAEVLAALRASQQESERLRARVDQLLRRLYGPRSERSDPNQPLLFADLNDPVPPAAAPPPPPSDEPTAHRKRGRGRRGLPKHLPRDRCIYELSEAERRWPGCGQARVVIGQEVSEELDYEPASLMVIEHVRLTYGCRCCEKQRHPRPPQHRTV
jgi:hypothetical protein